MSFQSLMSGGYPSESDIEDFLSNRGLESITENNPNFMAEWLQTLWGVLNAFDWAGALGVYCPSPITFNVRGGKYSFKGIVKTYATGSAINPTDNDTTYIWLKPDNTIGSDIDGNGWPDTEHIKLAEIDVDSNGKITAVRDLRGQTFLQYIVGISRLASVDSVDLNSVASTNLYTVPAGKVLVVDHIKIRNLSASAGNAVATFGQSGDKDDFLGAQTLSNLDAAGKAVKLQPVPNATPPAIVEYTAGEIFVVDVTIAAGSACTATFDVFGTLSNA